MATVSPVNNVISESVKANAPPPASANNAETMAVERAVEPVPPDTSAMRPRAAHPRQGDPWEVAMAVQKASTVAWATAVPEPKADAGAMTPAPPTTIAALISQQPAVQAAAAVAAAAVAAAAVAAAPEESTGSTAALGTVVFRR